MRADIVKSFEQRKIDMRFIDSKYVEKIESALWNSERVLYITFGNAVICKANETINANNSGAFIVTDKRVLFFQDIGGKSIDESVELPDIKSVDAGGSWMKKYVTVCSTTKTIQLLVGSKKGEMEEVQKSIIDAKNNFQAGGTGNSGNLGELEQLHSLLQKGVITQEEFDVKKRQLLGL